MNDVYHVILEFFGNLFYQSFEKNKKVSTLNKFISIVGLLFVTLLIVATIYNNIHRWN